MSGPAVAGSDTPLAQATGLAFRFIAVAVAVLAVLWLASGLAQVEPGMRAVVMRLGAPVREAPSGLVMAWPRPFERVVRVPGPEQQLTLAVDRLAYAARSATAGVMVKSNGLDPRLDGGYVLTGDAGVAHLTGTVVWRIASATRYVRANLEGQRDLPARLAAAPRVQQALERAFCAAAVAACAARPLDGVLVAGDSTGAAGEAAAQARDRLRADIASAMNRRLADYDLGIEVTRVDLAAAIPEAARAAFAEVASAEQAAAQEVAAARTTAERTAQQAQQARAEILAQASARAEEQVARARVATRAVALLAEEREPGHRALLLQRLWRDRLDAILRKTGGAVAVDGTVPVRAAVPAER